MHDGVDRAPRSEDGRVPILRVMGLVLEPEGCTVWELMNEVACADVFEVVGGPVGKRSRGGSDERKQRVREGVAKTPKLDVQDQKGRAASVRL